MRRAALLAAVSGAVAQRAADVRPWPRVVPPSTAATSFPPPGTQLEVQTCQSGAPTQNWTFGEDGSVRSAASGLCITAPGGTQEGKLTTDVCAAPPSAGQVFDWDPATGSISLKGTRLVFNASFGSWNYGWVRPYAPLGVAPPAGASPTNSTGLAPFQLFVVNAPVTGSIVANASLLSAAVCVDAGARAPLPLVSSVFGPSMVLQRDSNATALFGWAPDGASAVNVTVQVNGTTVASFAALPNASASGAWRQVLPRTPASLSPYTITVAAVGASSTPPTVLSDVLFGDVYLITGQSNAQFSVDLGVNVSAELAAANDYPAIRLFTVGIGTMSVVPLPALQTLLQPWSRASNASVGFEPWGAFSAVGWYFGRDLFNRLGGAVPIGLIGNNWGGTPIECWSDAEALARCPANGPVDPTTASTMSNAMIVPYTQYPGPMAVSGWVWYQGEANAGDPNYACRLPVLIDSWRALFGPSGWSRGGAASGWFGVVQLAAWDCCPGDAVALTRDIQLSTSLAHWNTGFGTAADLGDINSTQSSIHPRFKQPLGARLAESAFLMAGGAGFSATAANPVVSGVTTSASPPGSVAVTVAFTADSLGSGRLFINESIDGVCPWGVPEYDCVDSGWRVLTAADGVWRNATAAVTADGRGVTLTAPAPPAAGAPAAASLGWGSWPILSLQRADTGAVALPFLRYVSG